MEVNYEDYLLAALIVLVTSVPLIRQVINNKCKSLIMSHILAAIYLCVRILYISGKYKIYRYEEIENKYKYYGLFTNSLVLSDFLSFYLAFTIIYICSALIEYECNKMTIFLIWVITNILTPILIWLHYREIKQNYNFYILAYNYGLVSTSSALTMCIIVILVINDISEHKKSKFMFSMLFIGLFVILNTINLYFYDNIYNVINVNIGYLVGLIAVIINITMEN